MTAGSAVGRSLVFVLALAVAGAAFAQDAPNTSDHPLVSRYAGSVIDGYEVQGFDDFRLPVGPMARGADGTRSPSETKTLEGKITRILYRGPEGRGTLEIMRNYQSALEDAGFEVLYSCSDDCGYLFHWALYHDDTVITSTKTSGGAFDQPDDLRYLAATRATDEGVVHVAVMTAIDTIWTKQPVTLLTVIESAPMDTGMVTAAALGEGIDSDGHVAIYGIYFDTGSATVKAESDATLEEIGQLLSERPTLNLLVVGHTDNQGGFELNMDLSRRRAQAVVQALTSRFGVGANRLQAAGVGYLAPVASNDTEAGRAKNRRVELVKR